MACREKNFTAAGFGAGIDSVLDTTRLEGRAIAANSKIAHIERGDRAGVFDGPCKMRNEDCESSPQHKKT